MKRCPREYYYNSERWPQAILLNEKLAEILAKNYRDHIIMAPMTLRSTSIAAEHNTGPEAGPSTGNAATEANLASENVTISRAHFEAMQDIMLQHSATPPPGAATGSARAPVTTAPPVTPHPPRCCPCPCCHVLSWQGPNGRPVLRRSRDLYNEFIRQC